MILSPPPEGGGFFIIRVCSLPQGKLPTLSDCLSTVVKFGASRTSDSTPSMALPSQSIPVRPLSRTLTLATQALARIAAVSLFPSLPYSMTKNMASATILPVGTVGASRQGVQTLMRIHASPRSVNGKLLHSVGVVKQNARRA